MFEPNPYQRTLARLGYIGLILGLVLVVAGHSTIPVFAVGVFLLVSGMLAMIGGLIVGGVTYKVPKPSKD
jgi:hypothetical protein